MSSFDALFELIRGDCSRQTWSNAVLLTRSARFIIDEQNDEKIQLSIVEPGRPVCPRVVLWPGESAWECSVEESEDPGIFVTAAAIAVKNGLGELQTRAANAPLHIEYAFSRRLGELSLERYLVGQENRERLKRSLRETVGGIEAGRINLPQVTATADDYAIDAVLVVTQAGILPPQTLNALFAKLSHGAKVLLDGKTVQVVNTPPKEKLVVEQLNSGYRLLLQREAIAGEHFRNGAVLSDGILRPTFVSKLSEDEYRSFSGNGQFFPLDQAGQLFHSLLPELKRRIEVELSFQPPKVFSEPPRIILELRAEKDRLAVLPRLIYGTPACAEVTEGKLNIFSPDQLPVRDPGVERQLLRRLKNELHLQEDRIVEFFGEDAVRFRQAAKNWEIAGRDSEQFVVRGKLEPKLDLTTSSEMHLAFTLPSPNGKLLLHAASERVFQAWQRGEHHVPLLEGGWAELPKDWLKQYGEQILELLRSIKENSGKLPSYLLPQAINLLDQTGESDYPNTVRLFKEHLQRIETIPQSTLPPDLTANLRTYQRHGVNWLAFLRDAGIGALLADDMGLGKTIQALCTVDGRTLVVCPTSVLYEWKEQTARFRPALKVNIYYGANRTLDLSSDVVLTTYGHLRIDQETLTTVNWNAIILDESQTIKNPQSQVSQAAYRLNSRFRLALTGTPLENKLEELWSQFRFLNPGLLGSWNDFQRRFVSGRGVEGIADVANRVGPFILRRKKEQVAPELPPRTESILRCELDTDERSTYEQLWALAKQEFTTESGSMLHILEALLRLRQSCCHLGLIPGRVAYSSSKLSGLLDARENCIAEGHRALVFSQWTSLLDLIEPHFHERTISFTRLDGSTTNRGQVVEQFQSPDGPSVLLLSLKAGGTGLTLTAADHVFLLDSWWNPAVEQQAADRAHRIGQQNPVFVFRLIAMNTIEERILELQEEKRQLADLVLSGTASADGLTRDDILKLLS